MYFGIDIEIYIHIHFCVHMSGYIYIYFLSYTYIYVYVYVCMYMYLYVDVYLFCILQCTYVDSSPHPSLCSLERMLLRSYVAYVRRLRVSSLGFTYICSPFERVLSGSYWAPQHVFVNWGCPLLGSYVTYVRRVGCHPGSSRVHIYVRRSRGSPGHIHE
jgi:hypothetical protein